jgi:DNA-binding PadR family transcriptional regulator
MALRETILTVLTRGKMTGYEIAKDFDEVLYYFWQASHQQVYRELGRLEAEGCVTHEVVVQSGRPNKKVYSITGKGREELRHWVSSVTPLPRQRYDLLVKLLAGSVVEKSVLRDEILRHMAATEEMLDKCHVMEKECFSDPIEKMSDHDQVLYLALRRGLLHIEAQREWLKEVMGYLENGTFRR